MICSLRYTNNPKTQTKHIWAADRGWEGMREETGSGTREGLAQNDKEGGS